jgi:YesN/AraC family two-component response regulator
MGEYENPVEGVIVGPVLMGELSDFENTYGLPHMETARVNDLTEVASALFSPHGGERGEGTGDFLNAVYRELELLPRSKGYPIDLEKRLQSAIVDGDEANAREYLNRLLGEIFFRSNGESEVIKTRVLELLVLLSRSAIEGGADVSQIFALNNDYIREIDRFESVERLSGWLSGIINRFISYMFDFSDIRHSVALHKIMGYIRNNYMKRITLDDIADYVYMSRSRLSKIFNEEMGMSVSAYINRVRIERAKRLLHDPSLTIVDVANLTGFEAQSYFSKQFKAVVGVSPKKFREKMQ